MSDIILYRVIDNPEYFDRYTLCFAAGDEPFIIGASEDPFHPLGFGQYCGDWYIDDDQDIGEEIGYEDLPDKVKLLVQKHENACDEEIKGECDDENSD